jgi:IMP cyclohydrolase
MNNPCGPYPGRQLFAGLTLDNKPCFAYLVSGRSPESRQRKAITVDNTVRIGPLGNTPYDPLRHYTAVKYDDKTGTVAVTNGIQTEAIYESYKLIVNVNSPVSKELMVKLLDGADAEPDSLHTPRIAVMVIAGKDTPVFLVGIKAYNIPAAVYQASPIPGTLTGISTYKGNMDNPEPTDPAAKLPVLQISGSTPDSLAKYVYDISSAVYKSEDIRVCAVGGIFSGGLWGISLINKY